MCKDSVLDNFGKRIRKLRNEKGWSQEELSFKSGFHRTYIGMIERGERNPSLVNINIFARVFNLTLSELLNLENNGME